MNLCKKCDNRTAAVAVLVVLALVAVFLLDGCVTCQLERRLDRTLVAWYDAHEILMNYPIPEDIAGKKGVTEKGYFLRLPYALQCKYRDMFWKIRDFGTQRAYEARLEYVQRRFHNNLVSPLVRQILLCGLPMEIELYSESGEPLGMTSDPLDNNGWNHILAIWSYYRGSYRIQYGFECRGMVWGAFPLSTEAASNQARFERECQWEFAPTWNGWDEWRAVIGKTVGVKE